MLENLTLAGSAFVAQHETIFLADILLVCEIRSTL